MGVRGLSKFINENPQVLVPFKLHDTRVIIDGANFIHFLYARSGIDYKFGGNYSEFSETIREYFSFFFECNITPIIIFDGGHDPSNRMLEKLIERHENRLKNIQILLQGGDCGYPILPINTFEVFKNVLSELGIIFAQCDFDADNQMGSLAKYYQCPLMSDDSDFYIYDLPHGFIRLSSVETRVLKERKSNGTQKKYLEGNIFYTNNLLRHFPLRDKRVLSLLAVLAGNDYSNYDDFKQFFYKMKIYQKDKFKKLFQWLSNFSLKQATQEVLRLIDIEKEERIRTLIENSIDDYRLKSTNLIKLLTAQNMDVSRDFLRTSCIVAPCGESLPEQFVIAYHKGCIPSTLLDVITLHQQFLAPQVEELANPSSNECSRYIRQVMYGILIQHDKDSNKQHSKQCLKQIHEYDRFNNTVQRSKVQFLRELHNGILVPSLFDVYSIRKRYLRDFISSVLGADKKLLSDIPFDLHLIFASIKYWILNSKPKPTKDILLAILLCIVYHQLLKMASQETPVELRSSSTKNTSKGKLTFIQNTSHSNMVLITENLKKYLEKPTLSSSDMDIMYSFSQLQTCILHAVTLNSLVGVPYNFPKLHEIIDGTMLHNLTKDIQTKRNPDLFIKIMLGNEVEIINMFSVFQDKFPQLIPDKPQKKNTEKRNYKR